MLLETVFSPLKS